jgi:hypothetical protein
MLNCAINNPECFEAVYSRLLQVPYNAYRIFSNYYSFEATEKLYNILTQNIILAKNLTDAMIARDQQAANAVLQQWYDNIDILSV